MTVLRYVAFDAPIEPTFLRPALNAARAASADRLEAALRDVGECLWTARDLIWIRDVGGFLSVVAEA